MAAWRVTEAGRKDQVSVEVGEFARNELPGNAVLLCEEPHGYEHLTIMFYADRTCYPLKWPGLNETARQIQEGAFYATDLSADEEALRTKEVGGGRTQS